MSIINHIVECISSYVYCKQSMNSGKQVELNTESGYTVRYLIQETVTAESCLFMSLCLNV